MVKRVFDRGDIVRVCLNPTEGNEIKGDFRPCLVLSPKAFNQIGVTYVAPITQGGNFAREKGFTVSLNGAGTLTQGVILTHAIKSLDLMARKTQFIEKAPPFIMSEVLARIQAIFE